MDVYTIHIYLDAACYQVYYVFLQLQKSSISLICTCFKRISCSHYTHDFFIKWKYRFPVFWQLYYINYFLQHEYNFIFLHSRLKQYIFTPSFQFFKSNKSKLPIMMT